LQNYTDLLTSARFWNAVMNTFYFSTLALAFQLILGVAIALLLHRKNTRIAKTIFLMPMVATPVAMGLVWVLLFQPTNGVLNQILVSIGLKPLAWLGSVHTVIPSLVIVDVWEWTPMITLIVLAGLSTLPQEPFESAVVDGASSWQKLWYITLPMLRPTILVAVMLRLIDVLKTFDIIYATTQGGPGTSSETLNILGYVLAFQYYKFGSASALLVVFFTIVLGFTLLMIGLRKKLGRSA
jgi:multiple sugar transport system permease protein